MFTIATVNINFSTRFFLGGGIIINPSFPVAGENEYYNASQTSVCTQITQEPCENVDPYWVRLVLLQARWGAVKIIRL